MNRLPPAILLLGPTASGKTAAAFRLVDRFPVEIVSVDSAQVFRDMDVGTAKPDRATLAAYPHRLIDLISPEEAYSAARFRADALAAMAEITAAGRVPLLVGGTMLYYKALAEGLADLPQADPTLRAEIEADAARRGWPALHADLAALDPETAARLKPNDSQRIQRAIEVCRLSGRPMAELLAAGRDGEPPYRFLRIGLAPSDRLVLHERIAQRFRQMLDTGLISEVEMLRAKYRLHPDLPSMRCVGYRQVWEWMEGTIPRDELADRGTFATRQLAKRQLTWLKSMTKVEIFDCLDSRLVERIERRAGEFLGQ